MATDVMEANYGNIDDDVDVVVGLDIGTTKVVAVVGCRDRASGKIKILGYGKTESTGVVRGSVINIQKTANAVARAVEEASRTSNVDIREVYVGIAGQHIRSFTKKNSFVRVNNEDVITREEIEALKKEASMAKVQAGEVIIHVIPQTFTVDGETGIREDEFEGMTGSNIEVVYNIITADASAMRNIKRSVEMAGLELRGFILEPLVSAEAVLDATDKEAGVVLIDIGGGTTDLAVFMNGILCHTSVIPLAGNLITSDIKIGCNILPKQAEALKVKFGSALPSEASDEQIVSIPSLNGKTVREISLKQLAQIIRARLDEIFSHVTYEINNCDCDLDSFIGGIVLTGGGAKMKHIDKVCEYITHLDTRLASPRGHISPDSPEELNDPIFATSIGLVIYGVRCEEEKNIIHVPLAAATGMPVEPRPVSAEEEASDALRQEEPGPEAGMPEAPAREEKKTARKKGPGFQSMGRFRDWVVKIFDDDIR